MILETRGGNHLNNFDSTILIVENEPTLLELLCALLTERGFSVLGAMTAERALQVIETAKDVPVLLVLDYELSPGVMTGIDLYDHLQSIPGYDHIPALLVSSSLPSDPLSRMLRDRSLIGIPKPFNLDALLATIERYL